MVNNGAISSGESPYKNLHPLSFRPFQAVSGSAQTVRKSRCRLELEHPVTGRLCSIPANGWKWSEDTIRQMYKHDTFAAGDTFVISSGFVFGRTEKNVPRKLQYLDESMWQVTSSIVKMSYAEGKHQLPPGVEFTTPKPVSLIKHLLCRYSKKDAVVLDYFAGSGSTAQAVYELNKEDGGQRSWIMIEEMGSTFHEVLLKRLEYFDRPKDYGIYEVQTATVGDKELLNVFKKYSYDFLSAYHYLDESASITAAGINIVGYDSGISQIVAMTLPDLRRGSDYFEEELLALKQSIKISSAKSVLIYTIAQGDKVEEPWAGVDKSILAGTTCKTLQVVSIPSELAEEWGEVLTAIAG